MGGVKYPNYYASQARCCEYRTFLACLKLNSNVPVQCSKAKTTNFWYNPHRASSTWWNQVSCTKREINIQLWWKRISNCDSLGTSFVQRSHHLQTCGAAMHVTYGHGVKSPSYVLKIIAAISPNVPITVKSGRPQSKPCRALIGDNFCTETQPHRWDAEKFKYIPKFLSN